MTTTPKALSPPLHLPAPQTFDILPALHELLARIDHNPAPPSDTTLSDHLQPAPNDAADLDTQQQHAATDVGARYADQTPLDPKALPAEVLAIKARIRRALRELEALPDMDRGVEEQEAEIVELEGRVRRQREMIRKIGEAAMGLEGRVG